MDSDSDDSMPPVDLVVRQAPVTPPAAQKSGTHLPARPGSDSGDEMPPLQQVAPHQCMAGSGEEIQHSQKVGHRQTRKELAADSSDEMPPLQQVSPRPVGGQSEIDSADEMPPFQELAHGQVPEQSEQSETRSGDDMPHLHEDECAQVHLEPGGDSEDTPSLQPLAPHWAGQEESSSGDEMPPIQQVSPAAAEQVESSGGTLHPPQVAFPHACKEPSSDSEDDMPFLQQAMPGQRSDSSSEDGMPQLHEVEPREPLNESGPDSGDEMPPLQPRAPCLTGDKSPTSSGSEMPPLQQLGVPEGSAGSATSEDGMPTLQGTTQHQPQARSSHHDTESDDAMPPLDLVAPPVGAPPMGQRAKTAQAPACGRSCSDSEEEMPPLQAVGHQHEAAQPSEDREQESCDRPLTGAQESSSDDSLPPLEFINKPSRGPEAPSGAQPAGPAGPAGPAAARASEVAPGDVAVLVNLKARELNGERVRVVRLRPLVGPRDSLRLEVKLLSTGKLLAVKRAHVERLADEAVAKKSVASGDAVVLRNLSRSEYNGQRAVVLQGVADIRKDRVTVKLVESGRLLGVPGDKFEKCDMDEDLDLPRLRLTAAGTADDESDDSMPPLECIHKLNASSLTGDLVPCTLR